MKKCKGCGVVLQNDEQSLPGYVPDLSHDYCERCFRLTHYGDTKYLKTNFVTNEKILDIYNKYPNELFVVIIDVLDAICIKEDDLLETFKNNDILLIINKTDLLPSNITDSKIDEIFTKLLFDVSKKYRNIKSCILTNKFETNFNDQFFNILSEMNVRRLVFAGRANAGKSSLINKLLNNNFLTTSIYPGTTLSELEIDYRNYIFIDTPGLVDANNYSTHLNSEKYKLSKIDKTIKPQIFQFYEPQSYFYEGLLRIDTRTNTNCSISFYICNNNEIHRTKYENADNYYQKHYPEFKLKVKPLMINKYIINSSKLFVIKGLGLIKVNGNCEIDLYALSDVKIYTSEVDI